MIRYRLIGYTTETKKVGIYRPINELQYRSMRYRGLVIIHHLLRSDILVDSEKDAQRYIYKASANRLKNFHYCYDCKEWAERDCDYKNSDNEAICEECAEHYRECERCSETIHEDNTQWHERTEEALCESCMNNCDCSSCCPDDDDDDENDESPFLNYHGYYDKKLNSDHFKSSDYCQNMFDATKSAWSIPFGFELEFNFCRSIAEDVVSTSNQSKLPHVWMQDGSLSQGAELISKPIDRAYLNKCNLRKLLKDLKKIGCKAYDSGECGIHVHVNNALLLNTFGSKDAMQCAIVEILKLYKTPLKAFSKRSDSSLERYANLPNDYNADISWIQGERYRAINTCPSNTIEFRLYRGTTDYDRTYASILLSLAIHDYLLQIALTPATSLSLGEFIEQAKEYAFLKKYLIKEELFGLLFKTRKEQDRVFQSRLKYTREKILAQRRITERKQSEWTMTFENIEPVSNGILNF